ncbi:MAG: exosortase F system-associated protein [Cyclobacteriaceae bacterium]
MKNYLLLAIALITLLLVYVFQQVSYASWLNYLLPKSLSVNHPNTVFIINRTTRLIVNDGACMLLIWGFFKETKYLKAAFLVFCIELLIILPIYFVVKLNLEGPSEISSPLLSQIHRIIVNPLLMFILMVAFYYQKVTTTRV